MYDPTKVTYDQLLKVFWENHDPTQGMRQGNDVGTQYRSAIYTTTDEQYARALESRDLFQHVARDAGYGDITTEIAPAGDVLLRRGLPPAVPERLKNPNGYCNHGPNGMSCPIGVVSTEG